MKATKASSDAFKEREGLFRNEPIMIERARSELPLRVESIREFANNNSNRDNMQVLLVKHRDVAEQVIRLGRQYLKKKKVRSKEIVKKIKGTAFDHVEKTRLCEVCY